MERVAKISLGNQTSFVDYSRMSPKTIIPTANVIRGNSTKSTLMGVNTQKREMHEVRMEDASEDHSVYINTQTGSGSGALERKLFQNNSRRLNGV